MIHHVHQVPISQTANGMVCGCATLLGVDTRVLAYGG
jgi:hypothetical protein